MSARARPLSGVAFPPFFSQFVGDGNSFFLLIVALRLGRDLKCLTQSFAVHAGSGHSEDAREQRGGNDQYLVVTPYGIQ